MNNEFKDINIKYRTYYFFDDMINIKILIHIKSRQKVRQKYSYLLHWIRYFQRS